MTVMTAMQTIALLSSLAVVVVVALPFNTREIKVGTTTLTTGRHGSVGGRPGISRIEMHMSIQRHRPWAWGRQTALNPSHSYTKSAGIGIDRSLQFRPVLPRRLPIVSLPIVAMTATKSTSTSSSRAPSLVEDPDGPTPSFDTTQVDDIDVDSIPELREINDPSELPNPIPYQTWRRGDTAGCEAPIAASWRKQAQDEITKAVSVVGGQVLDVTWFLTTVLVTLDEDRMPPPDLIKDRGPVIEVVEPSAPVWLDPTDPEPDDIWADDDDVFYERQTPEEAAATAERTHNMYATVSSDDADPTESHIPIEATINDVSLYREKETRDEVALLVAEQMQERHADSQQAMDIDTIKIDTAVLSSLAHAIIEALKFHEDEWRILRRHELVLSSPNPAVDCLETQRQFDAYRNTMVLVETQDPFDSNRTLRGKLVDRNAMDVILNVRGRMVTVPHNFIKCVRLASPGTIVPDYNELVETEYIEEAMDDDEDFDEEDEDFDDE